MMVKLTLAVGFLISLLSTPAAAYNADEQISFLQEVQKYDLAYPGNLEIKDRDKAVELYIEYLLRYPESSVRHAVLSCIGDCYGANSGLDGDLQYNRGTDVQVPSNGCRRCTGR